MASLPFLSTGEVQAQGGATLAEEVPVSVWPATGSNQDVGRAFDHEGEADIAFAAQLQGPNKKLMVDGETYAIVEATVQGFVPHVALTLRRMRPGG